MRIAYNTRTTFGGIVAGLVGNVIQVQLTLERLNAVLFEMTRTNPKDDTPNWDQVEKEFGLVAGTGEPFYNIVSGMNSAFKQIQGLPSLDQG